MSFNAGKNYDTASGGIEQPWRRLIGTEYPELIAIQEPGVRANRFGVEAVENGLQGRGYTAFLRPDSTGLRNTYLVLSRLEIVAVEDIRFSGKTGEDSVPLALRTVFEWQGQRMVLYSVHLQSFREKPWNIPASRWRNPKVLIRSLKLYREDVRMRSHQANALKLRMEQESIPFIVAGDFNSTPHNWAYGRLSRGLNDVHHRAGRGLGLTFPADLPMVRIDYVLASREWGISSAEVLPASELSDHRAIIGRLVLNDAGMGQ